MSLEPGKLAFYDDGKQKYLVEILHVDEEWGMYHIRFTSNAIEPSKVWVYAHTLVEFSEELNAVYGNDQKMSESGKCECGYEGVKVPKRSHAKYCPKSL